MVGRRYEGKTVLVWLVNMTDTGSIPSTFVLSATASLMSLPRSVVDIAKGEISEETQDAFIQNLPKDLAIEDCLVYKMKHATITDQRAYFQQKMLEMAREGHDDEDGWTFFAKTRARELSSEQQIDIYEREVEWSAVKQLRSEVETTFSSGEVFDSLLAEFGSYAIGKHFLGLMPPEQQTHAATGQHYLLVTVGDFGVTGILLRDIPFPWPFSQVCLLVAFTCIPF